MIYPRVRDHVPMEELVSLANARAGRVGGALRTRAAGRASATFAAGTACKGAIMDGLRRMTQLPRRTWAKLVALRAASEYLEQRGERDRGATAATAPPARKPASRSHVKSAMSANPGRCTCAQLDAMREDGFDPRPHRPSMSPGSSTPSGARRRRSATRAREAAGARARADAEALLGRQEHHGGRPGARHLEVMGEPRARASK